MVNQVSVVGEGLGTRPWLCSVYQVKAVPGWWVLDLKVLLALVDTLGAS